MADTEEGAEIPFNVPTASKQCYTWYRVFGDFSQDTTPLLILHGGSGACHEYLLPYTQLTQQFGIPTIFYDQIGNGNSTHLPEKNGDDTFWTEELFRNELDNLVGALNLHERGFDLLGHSWGGMLGSAYACTQPSGLRRLIISDSPADVRDWEEAARRLVQRLPDRYRKILEDDEHGDGNGSDIEEAMTCFRSQYLCKVKPWPAPEIASIRKHIQDDPTVYMTMKGSSEIFIVGNLKTWQVKDRLHKIQVPVLLINGEDDQAQDNVVLPFFQSLQKVKWVTVDGASHNPHLEKTEKIMELVASFLSSRHL